MRLCKYCNKAIADEYIWNSDNDGNGYHHQCLVAMEFKARDKDKIDVLDKIKAEIEQKARLNEFGGRGSGKSIRYGLCMALEIIDKYKTESEDK